MVTYDFSDFCISNLVIGIKILPLPISIASFVRYLIPLTCTNVLLLGFFVDVTIVNIIPNNSFSDNNFDDKSGNYLM